MRADPQDQLRGGGRSTGFPVIRLLAAVAVMIGLLLYWFRDSQAPDTQADPPLVVQPAVDSPRPPDIAPAPDIPRRAVPQAALETSMEPSSEQVTPAATAAPIIDPGEVLLRQMTSVGADERLKKLVGDVQPFDISAKLIDGLSRGSILRKILPAVPPRPDFGVIGQGSQVFMSAASYKRYNGYAISIAALDVAGMVDSFHLLRPLYERAYEQLGLEVDDFDNAIIRVLDLILSTPELEGPVALKKKSPAYLYADPELEKLPSIQKQLLRMGPDNIRRIKGQARVLREGLLQS